MCWMWKITSKIVGVIHINNFWTGICLACSSSSVLGRKLSPGKRLLFSLALTESADRGEHQQTAFWMMVESMFSLRLNLARHRGFSAMVLCGCCGDQRFSCQSARLYWNMLDATVFDSRNLVCMEKFYSDCLSLSNIHTHTHTHTHTQTHKFWHIQASHRPFTFW